MSYPGLSNKFDVDPLSNSDSQKVQKYLFTRENSEGVFRQLYAEAWPRDHGWGHVVEMAGDEFLRWQVESKDEV